MGEKGAQQLQLRGGGRSGDFSKICARARINKCCAARWSKQKGVKSNGVSGNARKRLNEPNGEVDGHGRGQYEQSSKRMERASTQKWWAVCRMRSCSEGMFTASLALIAQLGYFV